MNYESFLQSKRILVNTEMPSVLTKMYTVPYSPSNGRS